MSGGGYGPAGRARLKRFAKLHQKKYRDREKLFLAEGLRTVDELLRHLPEKDDLVALFLEPRMLSSLETSALPADRIFLLDGISAGRLAGTTTSQGVVGVFRQQPGCGLERLLGVEQGRSLVLALDDVQDPGNVGTIVRTASWFGASALVSGPGCADRYNAKAVRASAGSVFCLPHHASGDLAADLRALRSSGYRIVCSCLHGDDVRLSGKLPEKAVLVVGNEARGIGEPLLDMADLLVTIPHAGADPGVESLNAAVSAAILMSVFAL
ncbi:rRNA methyltransferase [Prosthecochloris sp. GSB1]|uniref:TrmH family RNA methyltransferase n=1 Tax=Prosthecochloris sp. GSB1 TaxID=281093 RepID=UPI000B8C9155|nr:RNA methyltransferase [Prosthecochloris sp. GSB1]ASQ91236.1 rRNA methyltransferase [Prosthecochloris sp. GSB1]